MGNHNHAKEHEKIIADISREFKEIFETSKQGIYIYLDDTHKVCNHEFAHMLGFNSPEDWAKEEPFTDSFVAAGSQHTLVTAYRAAMEKAVGSTFKVTWKAKNGKVVKTEVILVPIAFGGEMLALHFIS